MDKIHKGLMLIKRAPRRGGNWNNGSRAGLFNLNLNNELSNANNNLGFRSAFGNSQMRNIQGCYVSVQSKGTLIPAEKSAAKKQPSSRPGVVAAANLPAAKVLRSTMKRYGNLYGKICEYENLYCAYRKARLGKRFKPETLRFSHDYEKKLFDIQEELICKKYHTGEYRRFFVFEPKEREIMSLPFDDRVVQHALCNILEPIFERSFIHDSFACRAGKGAQRGINRVENFINKVGGDGYALQCDIKKYFYSIDHDALKRILRKKIKCNDTLSLLNDIIDSNHSAIGIPIGNLTSQLFANIYLNELDHFIKEDLGIKHYVRYMDDFVILNKDKKILWRYHGVIKDFVQSALKLKFNNKTKVYPIRQGINFLGYRQFPGYRLLRKRNIRKNKRKFKKFSQMYAAGEISFYEINQSVQSFIGYAKWANSWRIRESILSNIQL